MTRRHAYQWAIFWLAMFFGGWSWPVMFVREDEKRFTENNAMLDEADADGDLSDGTEEAFWRVEQKGRFFHDVKNVGHEAFRKNPKFFYKFTGFVINVLVVLCIWGWIHG